MRWAIWKSSGRHGIIWFLHRPQSKDREAPGFCGLSKILTEKKAEVWDRKHMILFSGYMVNWDGEGGCDVLYKMPG